MTIRNGSAVLSDEDARALRARRGLGVYFTLVLLGSGVCEWLMIRSGRPIDQTTSLAVMNMWVPSLAALVARLVGREGVRDVSFRWGGSRTWRAVGVAMAFPVVVGALAYGGAWASGLEHIAVPAGQRLGVAHWPPAARFAIVAALNALVGTAIGSLVAAGEEFGWRGYMLTRLFDARVPRPVLVSGLVWGLWHVPLILAGTYASGPRPALSALVFVASIVAGSYVAARLRLETGSVWPAVIFHGAWNAIIQGVFDATTRGGSVAHTSSPWVGESGVLVALASVVVAAVFSRGTWAIRRTPGDEPAVTARGQDL